MGLRSALISSLPLDRTLSTFGDGVEASSLTDLRLLLEGGAPADRLLGTCGGIPEPTTLDPGSLLLWLCADGLEYHDFDSTAFPCVSSVEIFGSRGICMQSLFLERARSTLDDGLEASSLTLRL